MLLIVPLDGQTLPESWQEIDFFLNLRQETCPHVAVKVWQSGPRNHAGSVHQLCYTPRQCQSTTILASLHAADSATWWPNIAWKLAGNRNLETRNLPPCGCKRYDEMALKSCWECSSTCYTPIHCQTTTIQQPTCCYTPTWWPNIAWKLAGNRFFPDLRHETRQHVAVKVWWVDFQSCWECSSTCYTPMHCQTTTIQQPTCCYSATWWPNIAWKLAGNRNLETRNLPPCGCKRYDEMALEIMLGVFINFVIHPDNANQLLF